MKPNNSGPRESQGGNASNRNRLLSALAVATALVSTAPTAHAEGEKSDAVAGTPAPATPAEQKADQPTEQKVDQPTQQKADQPNVQIEASVALPELGKSGEINLADGETFTEKTNVSVGFKGRYLLNDNLAVTFPVDISYADNLHVINEDGGLPTDFRDSTTVLEGVGVEAGFSNYVGRLYTGVALQGGVTSGLVERYGADGSVESDEDAQTEIQARFNAGVAVNVPGAPVHVFGEVTHHWDANGGEDNPGEGTKVSSGLGVSF